MLRGTTVELRLVEPEDAAALSAWLTDAAVGGEFEGFDQLTPSDFARGLEGDVRWYVVRTHDGEPVGYANHGRAAGRTWIGYTILPAARGRGHATEAARLLVDYLFLHQPIERIQAETHPDNAASTRVLEKAGFRLEARLRRTVFSRGEWRDTLMFALLRDEWGGPRALLAM
jgi:RimJ/RimL family protein N-acetyltransferase